MPSLFCRLSRWNPPSTSHFVPLEKLATSLPVHLMTSLDSGVEAKGKADFVTEVDLAAEEEIISSLQKTYPDHAFLCEESGRTGP